LLLRGTFQPFNTPHGPIPRESPGLADADVGISGVAARFVLDGALDLMASLRLKVCGSSGST
jgi:hypothetical protein